MSLAINQPHHVHWSREWSPIYRHETQKGGKPYQASIQPRRRTTIDDFFHELDRHKIHNKLRFFHIQLSDDRLTNVCQFPIRTSRKENTPAMKNLIAKTLVSASDL